MLRAVRLRFWFLVMDAVAMGREIPQLEGLRRRVFFWAVGKAYETERMIHG